MSKILFILSFLLVSSSWLHGQNTTPAAKDSVTEKIVQLKPLTMANDTDKIVILFQSDTVEIQTMLSLLKGNLEAWIKKHPRLYDDKTLYSDLLKYYPGKDILMAREIAPHSELIARLNFRTADLLENGECRIINKKDNSDIGEIRIQNIIHNCQPGCGYGERKFFGGDILVFKVVDWRK
jgi:hypothetical protein